MNDKLFPAHIEYMIWADQAILEAVSKLGDEIVGRDAHSSHGGILGTLQHMYKAETIWLERIQGNRNAQVAGVTAPADLPGLTSAWAAQHQKWKGLAEEAQDWNRIITHLNQAGATYTLPLWQLILHVVNHSTLHRGQVMSMIRQAGTAPPNTDLITYYRTHAAALG